MRKKCCARMNATGMFWVGLIMQVALPWNRALAAEPISLTDFFRPPVLSSVVMSPSGRYIAATMAGGAQGRQQLVMLNLQDLPKSKVLAAFSDADIRSVTWVNDDRLVYTVTDTQSPYGDQLGAGLFAVDREGHEGKHSERNLIKRAQSFVTERSRFTDRELSVYHSFHSVLRDGSNDVVVRNVELDGRNNLTSVTLLRLDTVSGRARALTQGGPAYAQRWALDLHGVPRVAVSEHAGKSRLHWKASADAPWTMVREYDTFADDGRGIPNPVVVGANDVLYFTSRSDKDTDTSSLMRLDMSKNGLAGQPVISLTGYDFGGDLVFGSRDDLLGVHYLTDARATHWFDPVLKSIQAKVDSLLPHTNNRIDCGACQNPATVLVTSSSDRQPAIFYLYDAKAGALQPLAQSRPWLKPQTMARRDMQRFAARDGLSIPVHVTRPAGQNGPAPMVVMVHGGPWLRGGEWAWYAESQFLASRGYVVVEPEFRGSTGFGFKHFRAGWKQWGLAMQDDIADATQWAIKQGYADARRVCIAGASYGGYATLMGLIRYPDIYRCGIDWVGVTDIDLMYSIGWSDMSDMWMQYGMPVLVGDRDKDANQLAATSPLNLAAKLTQPLLMAYGGQDRRVPIDHGTRLRNALSQHNTNLEWVVYSDEAHGWMAQANKVDFWTRVERFLERHLKVVQ
jgi:dipeptidyl aminopeptidase/acylaminoacyl peptidase